MKTLLNFCFAITLVLGLNACTEEEIAGYDENAPAPIQISNLEVEETPGGAILTYDIPKDPNLLYVEAEYEIQPGVFREAKSSIYKSKISLIGFGDTLRHEVKLYSVGKNKKASDPVSVFVNPLEPPVQSVFETLNIKATFGGINVSFENRSQADLAIIVVMDSTGAGNWTPVTTFYTGATEGSFSARGFESEEKEFAVLLRDRWNNKSDTLKVHLTPLFEELIPKHRFTALKLPTDSWQNTEHLVIEELWDDRLKWQAFATPRTNTMPQWFTIDLGAEVELSRLKMFTAKGHTYADSGVKHFEIWGTNEPDPSGSWNNWEKLGSFTGFKPSGTPLGQLTPEDENYSMNIGDDFEFEGGIPAVRYIRFKTLESYGGGGQIVISELTFWGQEQ